MTQHDFRIEEKIVPSMLVASIRMTGRYSDCGIGFRKIGRTFGRYISGKAMTLCLDNEYRKEDATFEVVMPVQKGESTDEIKVYDLPGGRCLSVMYKGAYEELGAAYDAFFTYTRENGIDIVIPTRSVYVKGPGMIFRGNPKNYVTEIQMLIQE